MEMTVSIVMPVHNEEQYLPYSLPSLKKIKGQIYEYIFVLDNCSDKSEQLIKQVFPNATFLYLNKHKWNFYAAEAFQTGFNYAKGDVIWATGADLIVDPNIPKIIRKLFSDEKVGTVCFRYLNFDIYNFRLRLLGHCENLYKTLLQHIRREARHTGFYAFRKKMMLKIGGLADVCSEYDEYCRRAEKHGWKVVYVPYTKTLHLRPGLTRRKQYIQGVARASLPTYNMIKTIFHSFIHLKPYLFVGYIHAKYYGVVEAGTLR